MTLATSNPFVAIRSPGWRPRIGAVYRDQTGPGMFLILDISNRHIVYDHSAKPGGVMPLPRDVREVFGLRCKHSEFDSSGFVNSADFYATVLGVPYPHDGD